MLFAVRLVVAGLGLAFATGCAGTMLASNTPAQSAPLMGGAIVATGPAGYCVDQRGSRLNDGFALIAACATIQDDETGAVPRLNSIITVQADAAGTAFVSGSEDSLAAFLQTTDGATMLSDRVEVLAVGTSDAAVSVFFRDLSGNRMSNTQAEVWRVFTDISGHGVTISLRGLASEPLSKNEGDRLLQGVLSTMRAANRAAT